MYFTTSFNLEIDTVILPEIHGQEQFNTMVVLIPNNYFIC
jgi:hypothetical protein